MTFNAHTFARTPARADADTMPEAAAPSLNARASGRRLYSLVGVAGLLTYGFGIGPVLELWLR